MVLSTMMGVGHNEDGDVAPGPVGVGPGMLSLWEGGWAPAGSSRVGV